MGLLFSKARDNRYSLILESSKQDLQRQRRELTDMQLSCGVVVESTSSQPCCTTFESKSEEIANFNYTHKRSASSRKDQSQQSSDHSTIVTSATHTPSAIIVRPSALTSYKDSWKFAPARQDVHKKEQQEESPRTVEKKTNHLTRDRLWLEYIAKRGCAIYTNTITNTFPQDHFYIEVFG